MRPVSSMIPLCGLLAGRRDSHRASAWQADAYPATLALSVSATVVPPARQRGLGEQHAFGINVLPADGTLASSATSRQDGTSALAEMSKVSWSLSQFVGRTWRLPFVLDRGGYRHEDRGARGLALAHPSLQADPMVEGARAA